ncbi:DUF695 domain-containing protein [Myxococcus sp. K38C18041901]|uniref:DUF695 domain-containing protein n=1 Tax=Myxococcus guangdongensis TaxID=2906760 RepID=UPI0020A80559|nr:DUF695 domain-containing protein [Myxococcus guangdongensis]MCP3057353.1 DUF695 domain-containing protein [Myxococcus guangdongensis]
MSNAVKSWDENFDTYLMELEDGPTSFLLDMTAAAHAPLTSHPLRLTVRVVMKSPRPDGLRSREESEALFNLEDGLVPALGTLGFHFVGRSVGQGLTEAFFFGPRGVEQSEVQRRVTPVQGDYTLELELEEDPEWSVYFDWLYPPELHRHLMSNRSLLDLLAKQGDRSEVAREVDHLAHFPSEEQALRAGAQLTKQGFKVSAPRAPEAPSARWAVSFTREDSLAEGRADAVTVEILEVLQAHEGDYDGWGCVLTTMQ